jgi:hypothetical protein
MAWIEGSQSPLHHRFKTNEEIEKITGFLEEKEARLLLYHFLRQNLTFTTNLITGMEIYPFQHLAIKAMLESDYFLAVWGRGLSKTTCAAIFIILDSYLNQGVETGIISSSFRQSKMIFNSILKIAEKPEAYFLRQAIANKIRRTPDEYVVNIGKSVVHALPLGDGAKLRGFRFQRLIIDEFLLMPEKIFNEVILPFASIAPNPVERQQVSDAEDELIKQGKMEEKDRQRWDSNKIICLSSASYKIEFLHTLYQQYENQIIKPKDNSRCCVMHLSYECAPSKLYDEKMVNQSRQTMSEAQFSREYDAQFSDESAGYYKPSVLNACTIPEGQEPTVEIKGEAGAEYIVSIDSSWSQSETSDDFAMSVLKINHETNTTTLVHAYALPGTSLKNHINYFIYLYTHFNVVNVIMDYNGGIQFLEGCNESEAFKEKGWVFQIIDVPFDKPEEYEDDLKKYKVQYNKEEKRIVIARKPTSYWIVSANQCLQGNLEHKRIFFGSFPFDASFNRQVGYKVPLETFKYCLTTEDVDATSNIEFVEHQVDMIKKTKQQCALIKVGITAQGLQSFDLPENLKRLKGPNRQRKDSYSSLVLGNWMSKIVFDSKSVIVENVMNTFTPSLI